MKRISPYILRREIESVYEYPYLNFLDNYLLHLQLIHESQKNIAHN